MKPARSPARMGVLPTASAKPSARDRLVGRAECDDDLHELHHGDGREEVQAEHVLGPRRGRGEVGDRDGGRVGGQQRTALDGRVEPLEDAALHGEVLDDGLDDEVAVRQVADVAGPGDAPLQGLGGVRLELAAGHGAADGRGDALPRPLERRLLGLVDVHRDPGARHGLGDARAHEAASDDGHLSHPCHAAGA
jgi:hypothetical protein